jgi:hypothetical protein
MVSIKDLLEPYALRRRTHTRYYVGLLTITTALLIFSIVLDYAGSYLATPLIQLGSLAFFATIILGIAESSTVQNKTRRNILFMVLNALGNTSYSVLPFFVASVAVLFYLGGPSSQTFFQNLKIVITSLGILVAAPLLAKIVFLQLPILYQQLRESRILSVLIYVASFTILAMGVISYRFATYILDKSLLTWYMYETFLFFLELLFLYLSAEAAYWGSRDTLFFTLVSYVGVTTFSTLGILEAAKLNFFDYSNSFPKIVTGLVLLGANTGVMDTRISNMALEPSAKGQPSPQEPGQYPRLMAELADTVEKLRADLRLNRMLVERQQTVLQRLYDMTEKAVSQQSDETLEGIRDEIKKLRETTLKTIRDPIEDLFAGVRDSLLKQNMNIEQLKAFIGFLVGPSVPEALLLQGKRFRDVNEVSPFPLLLLFYAAVSELETGRRVENLKKVGFASFLITRHPKFKGTWTRRTAQDFLSDIFAGYVRPHRVQAEIILREEKGEEFLRTDGVAGHLVERLKEYAEAMDAAKDANPAFYGLKKVGERLTMEFELAPGDVAQYTFPAEKNSTS